MTEQNFEKFMKRMDEVWAHKEAVASNVLYDYGKKMTAINETQEKLQGDIKDLNTSLQGAVRDIRSDMKLKHQEIAYISGGHERRLSFVEKVLLSVATMIGMAFMGGLIAVVFK